MNRSSGRATILMSGGIDSAACAHHARLQGLAVEGFFIDYGQAAAEHEAKAAVAMANYLGIKLEQVRLLGTKTTGPGELLGRNVFLIFTALFQTGVRSQLIGIGLHAGTPYYDCSEDFLANATKLVAEHTDGRVSLLAPFINWTKKDVYQYFKSARLPILLTYSCEAGVEPGCGACASCRDREALGC